MYPLSKATENFKAALEFANRLTVEKGATYVGSEHFVHAFLCLPQCSAYQVLTQCGVTRAQYEQLFFPKIDTNSKYEGLTRRTQHMYDTAAMLAEDANQAVGTTHMLYAILEVEDCFAVQILKKLVGMYELKCKTWEKLQNLSTPKSETETVSNIFPPIALWEFLSQIRYLLLIIQTKS